VRAARVRAPVAETGAWIRAAMAAARDATAVAGSTVTTGAPAGRAAGSIATAPGSAPTTEASAGTVDSAGMADAASTAMTAVPVVMIGTARDGTTAAPHA